MPHAFASKEHTKRIRKSGTGSCPKQLYRSFVQYLCTGCVAKIFSLSVMGLAERWVSDQEGRLLKPAFIEGIDSTSHISAEPDIEDIMRSISNANSSVAAAYPSKKSASAQVRLQHIRNATIKLKYAGVTFLIDPMLAEKGQYPGLPGTYQSHIRNPTVDLPLPASEIIDDVDAVILTHAHPDHWDETAEALIPKNIPVFVQNQLDAKTIRSQNFENVVILADKVNFRGVSICRTEGIHGPEDLYSMSGIGEILGEVMGVVLQADGRKTVYIAGDTVWGSEVEEALQIFKPDIIVLNAGHALLEGLDHCPILMGKQAVREVALAAPSARIVAVHLEAINHCTLSRTELRSYLEDHGIGDHVFIPEDGGLLML